MTEAEIIEFREWHEKRLMELNYPEHIENKLRNARELWFPKPKK